MNVELLERIKVHILEDPRRLYMDAWIGIKAGRQPRLPLDRVLSTWEVPDCGTVACIAGWAVILSRGDTEWSEDWEIDDLAADLLDLKAVETDRLFLRTGWPHDLSMAYQSALDARDYARAAQVAVEQIDHFIAKHGDHHAD